MSMAGIGMLTTCSRPVMMSQMPNNSIPSFLLSFMLFTPFCVRSLICNTIRYCIMRCLMARSESHSYSPVSSVKTSQGFGLVDLPTMLCHKISCFTFQSYYITLICISTNTTYFHGSCAIGNNEYLFSN